MTALHRRPGIASVATLVVFTLSVGAAHLVAPEWARAAGLDVWNAAAERADLARTLSRGKDLEALNEHIQAQIRAGDAVAARLAAGRLTLAAATDELVALNADRPAWADGLTFSYPDAPAQRHRVARYVIAKLARAYEADPSAWAPLSARLEAEYRALAG